MGRAMIIGCGGVASVAISAGIIILFLHSTKEFKTLRSSLLTVLKRKAKAGAKQEKDG